MNNFETFEDEISYVNGTSHRDDSFVLNK